MKYEVHISINAIRMVEAESEASAVDRIRADIYKKYPELFLDPEYTIQIIPELVSI